MPDPICSSSSSTLCEPALIDPPETDACMPDASAPPQAPDGSTLLTAKFDNRDYRAFIRDQREAGQPDAAGASKDVVAGSVMTHSSQGSDVHALYASVRHDQQFDVQVGVLHADRRGEQAGFHLSSSVDVSTLRANLGGDNDDGTTGFNLGVMATVGGTEATIERSGWSATFGVSASAGVFISSGEGRDIDGDGVPERCFKGSIGPLTLGVCTEL